MAGKAKNTNEAISEATSDWFKKQQQANVLLAEAEQLRAKEVDDAVLKGNNAVAALAELGETYAFAKVEQRGPGRPRGPRKKAAVLPEQPQVTGDKPTELVGGYTEAA